MMNSGVKRETASGSQRGTFRVAAANRLLAETLPKVVFHEKTVPRKSLSRVGVPVRRVGPRADPVKTSDRVVRREAPLSKPSDDRLKCRPKDSRKSGGSGSRDFVPWSRDSSCS